MKVLILGSQGFIGSSLVSFFLKNGHQVTGCDLIEFSSANYVYHKVSIHSADFDVIFSSHSFDVCINASGSGNVGFSIEHPLSDFEANTYSVVRVLDCLKKNQPKCKYIHLSSAAVYGNPQKLPVKESDPTEPLSPYGFHKLMSEMICKEYHVLYQLPVAGIRPFSVYGNGLKKQLLWDICNKLQQTDNVQLFGTGNESRDFLHVNDLARLIDTIISSSDFTGNIYNAASGEETTIRDISLLFEKHFGTNKKIKFTGEVRKGDPLNWRADTTKTKELGFTPSVNLEQGVQQYIEWFRQLNPR